MEQNEKGWQFSGTPWEFIQMVRQTCVVCEYARLGKKGILKLLTDSEAYRAAAEETGITYEVVKETMRRELAAADHLDQMIEAAKSKGSSE